MQNYYDYPRSICGGSVGRYPIRKGLDRLHNELRDRWLVRTEQALGSPLDKLIHAHFMDSTDNNVLKELLAKHGLFAERWFRKALRPRMTERIANLPISLADFGKLLADKPSVADHFARKPHDAIDVISYHIFDQEAYKLIHEQRVYDALEDWYDHAAIRRPCAICRKGFRLIDMSEWGYYHSNGYTACCIFCPSMLTPEKEELPYLIKQFVEVCGFVPDSQCHPFDLSFSVRIPRESRPEILIAYGKMGGVEYVKQQYGSWFAGLAASGILPSGTSVSPRGIRCIAQDGHLCFSLVEQQIDNWLSLHGLSHEREPSYPIHPVLNPKGTRRADWLVNGIFIEYFGLTGEPNYDAKTSEKITLAHITGTKLLAIYPMDLARLEAVLAPLLL